jgi:uncharacterized protein YbjT (DUF2867 family)
MKAFIIGSTGLIGYELISQLLADPKFKIVVSISRRPLSASSQNISGHEKLREIIFDFKNWNELKNQIISFDPDENDAAFCTLGTTLKKAGTPAAFRAVDHDLVCEFAACIRATHVGHFLVVSALGASSTSLVFYNRVKGEMEGDLKKLEFPHLTIARPSLLLGERDEARWGESLATRLSPVLQPLFLGPLKKYQPIGAERVAAALVTAARTPGSKIQVLESSEMI